MTESQVDGPLQAAAFDPHSADHIAALTAMHQGYLLEELERTGHHAQGFPLAGWLRTIVLGIDNTAVGFVAADLNRRSVELVYVAPEHRAHGLAGSMLAELSRTCPAQLTVKAPLSPAGEALANRLGLPVVQPTAAQERQGVDAQQELHRALDRRCHHRRSNPAAVCRRCLRSLLTRSAEAHVMSYVALVRAYGTR